MPEFEDLRRRYMRGGRAPAAPPSPSIHAGCEVVPRILGPAYYTAIKEEIERPDASFVYIAGWWLDPEFSLDGAGGPLLTDVLNARSRAGVDVRVLGWVIAPEVLQNALVQRVSTRALQALFSVNAETMTFITQFNFTSGLSILGLPTNAPLAYARSGAFEIKDALECAVAGAYTYIYVEDQLLSSCEVLDWINAAVRANARLRVIPVTCHRDPDDSPDHVWSISLSVAVNEHLLRDLSAEAIDRIALLEQPTNMVHAKAAIVDDAWAMVGSANISRRSLYTDIEHAIAYVDEDGSGIPTFRADLWALHLGERIPDLGKALNAWFAIPFKGDGRSGTSRSVDRLRLPLHTRTFSADEQVLYDEILDPDSRTLWGGRLVSHYVRGPR